MVPATVVVVCVHSWTVYRFTCRVHADVSVQWIRSLVPPLEPAIEIDLNILTVRKKKEEKNIRTSAEKIEYKNGKHLH